MSDRVPLEVYKWLPSNFNLQVYGCLGSLFDVCDHSGPKWWSTYIRHDPCDRVSFS